MDVSVVREERFELFVVECMWMRTYAREDHEICNVDDADPEVWSAFAQEGGGSDNFERDLHTYTHKYPEDNSN